MERMDGALQLSILRQLATLDDEITAAAMVVYLPIRVPYRQDDVLFAVRRGRSTWGCALRWVGHPGYDEQNMAATGGRDLEDVAWLTAAR